VEERQRRAFGPKDQQLCDKGAPAAIVPSPYLALVPEPEGPTVATRLWYCGPPLVEPVGGVIG